MAVVIPDPGVSMSGHLEAFLPELGAIVSLCVGGFFAFVLIRKGIKWARRYLGGDSVGPYSPLGTFEDGGGFIECEHCNKAVGCNAHSYALHLSSEHGVTDFGEAMREAKSYIGEWT